MVFVFACDLISLILIDYLSKELLTPCSDSKTRRIFFILGFLMMCLLNFNGASSMKALLILCLYSLYVYIMFEGSVLYKCLCVIPYFTFQIIAEVFVGFVLSNVFHMTISKDMLSHSYIIGLVFSFVLLIFMTIVYVKMFKYIQGNELPWYTWFVFVVPIFTIFLLTSIEDYFLVFNTSQNDIFYILALLCTNMFLIVIFFLVFQSHKMNEELKITYLKNESYKMRYQLLEQHHNIHFHLLHELLHSHTEIYQLLEEKQYKEAQDKLDKLSNIVCKEFNALYSNSVIMNELMSQRIQKIMGLFIHCKTVFEDNDMTSLSMDTQYELLEYLLDIGKQYCQDVNKEHRIIIFKSKKNDNQHLLKVVFPYSKDQGQDIEEKIDQILKEHNYEISMIQKEQYLNLMIQL